MNAASSEPWRALFVGLEKKGLPDTRSEVRLGKSCDKEAMTEGVAMTLSERFRVVIDG